MSGLLFLKRQLTNRVSKTEPNNPGNDSNRYDMAIRVYLPPRRHTLPSEPIRLRAVSSLRD